jgi:hypothetical protein
LQNVLFVISTTTVLVIRGTYGVYGQGLGVLDLEEVFFGDHPVISIVSCDSITCSVILCICLLFHSFLLEFADGFVEILNAILLVMLDNLDYFFAMIIQPLTTPVLPHQANIIRAYRKRPIDRPYC